MLGLALDLGRVYIAKNEAQSYTDTAALAAALALNDANFTAAQDAVARNTENKWNMGTTSFTTSSGGAVTTEFARALPANASRPDPDTWAAAPPTAAGYMFVRVTASVAVQLFILPVVGTSHAQLVRAASVAGQVPLTSFKSGLLPFSPIVHASGAAANPPFGMETGKSYTLRYPGAALANSDLCSGDHGDSAFLTVANKQPPDEHGFYQDPQESLAGAAVVDGVMKFPVVFPGKIKMSGGAMDAVLMALNERINFDTDHLSTTYAQYQANIFNGKRVGNGFRLVGAPVNAGPADGGGARDIVGFGGFFLSSSSTNVYYSAGDKVSWCAEYYGVWNKAGQGAGPGTPGVAYASVLVQ